MVAVKKGLCIQEWLILLILEIVRFKAKRQRSRANVSKRKEKVASSSFF